ncbi:MAG: M48 family peptidase, partial [Bacteroidetes bacterium]|nr:M48 family peptidase [Bacteroidota bacterium]
MLAASLLGALLMACQKNAITGRRSLDLMPESEMISMSLTEYDKFLSEHKPLPDSDKRTQMVRSVGTKIQHA